MKVAIHIYAKKNKFTGDKITNKNGGYGKIK